MAGGNYSLLFLYVMIAKALGSMPGPDSFERLATILRIALLGGTAALVLVRWNRSIEMKASSLFLAHFVSYGQVWEHHLSAVVVIGCLMLVHLLAAESTSLESSGWRTVTLVSLIVLVVPTPWPLLDPAKDPAVFDPSQQWPTLVTGRRDRHQGPAHNGSLRGCLFVVASKAKERVQGSAAGRLLNAEGGDKSGLDGTTDLSLTRGIL